MGFAETPEQWEVLLRHRANSKGSFYIIAVTPEIDYLAEESGGEYLTVEDFVEPDKLNAIGDDNLGRVARLAHEYDNILGQVADHVPRYEWVSAMGLYHHLKGFYDNLYNRAVPVVAAFEQLKPDYVVSFPQAEYRIPSLYLFDKSPLSLTSRIVPLAAKAFQCVVEHFPRNQPVVRTNHKAGVVKALLLYLLKFVRRRSLNAHSSSVPERRDNSLDHSSLPLLIQNVFEDLGDEILETWKREGYGRISTYGELFSEHDIRQALPKYERIGRKLWKRIMNSPEIMGFFKYGEIDLFPLAEPFLRYMSLSSIPDLLAFAGIAERSMKTLKRAVILTGGMVDRNSVVTKAANEIGIPVVSIHYGGFLGYSRLTFHERYDMAGADYFVCNGSGAVKTFEKPCPSVPYHEGEKRAKPVALGAAWIEELVSQRKNSGQAQQREGVLSQGRTIMYVAQALVGDNRYLGYVFPFEIWYWRFLREIFELFVRYPEVTVLFKPPLKGRYVQIENPISRWLRKRRAPNVEVVDDVPLKEVINDADAFIIDSPSTPLLHLIATEKPFIVYSDNQFYKFIPEAETLLRKRALFAASKKEFFEQLEAFLQKPNWSLQTPVNDEFLLAYGTYKSDGRSAHRCAQFLYEVATGGSIPSEAESA